MLEFPNDVSIYSVRRKANVRATVIRLNRDIAAKRIDGTWWKIDVSKTLRSKEGDHHWEWRKLYGEFRNNANWDGLGIQRSDGSVMSKNDLDYTPVTGGADLADAYLRGDTDSLRDLRAHSDLDRHIVQLLALHKKLRVQFRNQDLASLGNATKRALLQDMNDLLGIKPLQK